LFGWKRKREKTTSDNDRRERRETYGDEKDPRKKKENKICKRDREDEKRKAPPTNYPSLDLHIAMGNRKLAKKTKKLINT